MGSAQTRRKASHTLGGQFVRQLRALRETLAASECQVSEMARDCF